MALDATVGGPTANSYLSLSDATALATDRLDAAEWSSATMETQAAALIMATSRLNLEAYTGSPVTYTQALAWPRYFTFDVDQRLIASDSIPLFIKRATFEYALALLKEPTLWADSGLQAFQNVKIGSLDVTPRGYAAPPIPDIVKRLIAPVRRGGSGTPVHHG